MNIDLNKNDNTPNNYQIDASAQSVNSYLSELKKSVGSISPKYDAIMCTAGSFAMNSIKSEGFFDGYAQMHQANVLPS
jgi:hypothetical protein